MSTFFTKLAMLFMFLLAVTFGWAALTMVFPVSLINILLGIVSAFFLLRAFELADKVNKLGPYADPNDKDTTHMPLPPMPGPGRRPGPMFGQGNPNQEEEDMEIPDEE